MTYKQVIVVRKDLKLDEGKLATQVAHACVGSLKLARKSVVKRWEDDGGKKVVLKVENLRKLNFLYKKCKSHKLPCFLVKDAGLTQLKPGTITCFGIGPAEEKDIDKVTSELKLL